MKESHSSTCWCHENFYQTYEEEVKSHLLFKEVVDRRSLYKTLHLEFLSVPKDTASTSVINTKTLFVNMQENLFIIGY